MSIYICTIPHSGKVQKHFSITEKTKISLANCILYVHILCLVYVGQTQTHFQNM